MPQVAHVPVKQIYCEKKSGGGGGMTRGKPELSSFHQLTRTASPQVKNVIVCCHRRRKISTYTLINHTACKQSPSIKELTVCKRCHGERERALPNVAIYLCITNSFVSHIPLLSKKYLIRINYFPVD